MTKQVTGKVLISISIALSAIVSTVVDLRPGALGHVYNPDWNPHAIFHDIVMFLLLDQMALVSLWLLWRKSTEPLVGVRVATLLVVCFWTPFYYVTSIFPMASLSANLQEMQLVSIVVGGVRLYQRDHRHRHAGGRIDRLLAVSPRWDLERGHHA